MKKHEAKESDFKLIADKYPVKIAGYKNGPQEKVRMKIGDKTVVTYENSTVDGKEVPNAISSSSKVDTYGEKTITTRLVSFEFLNESDEKEWTNENYR